MRRFLIGGLLLVIGSVVGCGGPSYGTPVNIKGKVKIGGQPAKDAQIIFQAKEKLPADKRTATADLKPDGTFEIANVYPADYDVFLQAKINPDTAQASATPTSSIPVNEDGGPITKPAKVPDGANDYTFEF